MSIAEIEKSKGPAIANLFRCTPIKHFLFSFSSLPDCDIIFKAFESVDTKQKIHVNNDTLMMISCHCTERTKDKVVHLLGSTCIGVKEIDDQLDYVATLSKTPPCMDTK
jgi:hypothetical protein